MYDPTIGVWISEDPIGFEAADENLRRYVGNNPTMATDPSGSIQVLTVGNTPAMSMEPPNAGAYAGIWLDLDQGEINTLTNAGGGFLIETNHLRYEVRNGTTGDVIDSADRTLWFLMYYNLDNNNNLISHHSHRQENNNLRQYKQLFNWQWGGDAYGLDQLKGTTGLIAVTSTFELYAKGTTVAHRDRFSYIHDELFPPQTNDLPGGQETIPGMSVGEGASGFTGDFIDEVGYVSTSFPWRQSVNRNPISQITVRIEIAWDWCQDIPQITVRNPGSNLSPGPDRAAPDSLPLSPRPDWHL